MSAYQLGVVGLEVATKPFGRLIRTTQVEPAMKADDEIRAMLMPAEEESRDAVAPFDALMESRPSAVSWARTLKIQAFLCLAFYAAFHIGTPQADRRRSAGPADPGLRLRRDPDDFYFISVRGGAGRALQEQARLLRQMERTAKEFKVKFVVNIAELGEEDQLRQNASSYFASEIPWFTTTVSQGQPTGMFSKKIKLPHGKWLDIVSIDTGSLLDHVRDRQLESIQDNKNSQLSWINETLSVSDGYWRIVVGFDSLIVCEVTETTETIKFNKLLHGMFIQYGVDAYLSEQGCFGYFHHRKGISYIGNPGPADKLNMGLLMNANAAGIRQKGSGFLLHKLNSLEMESYFIDSEGNMMLKTVIHQEKRDAI